MNALAAGPMFLTRISDVAARVDIQTPVVPQGGGRTRSVFSPVVRETMYSVHELCRMAVASIPLCFLGTISHIMEMMLNFPMPSSCKQNLSNA